MGMLPKPAEWSKDPWTKFGGRFQSIEDRQAKLESARTFVYSAAQDDVDSMTLPSSSTEYLVTNVAVPAGYSQALALVFCSTGTSFIGSSGSGMVTTQVVIADQTGVLVPSTTPGPGSVSAVSTLACEISSLIAGSSLRLSMFASATASGLTQDIGKGNVHLSASVMFLR